MVEEVFDQRKNYFKNCKSTSGLEKINEIEEKNEKNLFLSSSVSDKLNRISKLRRKSPTSLSYYKATWTSESDLTSPFNERHPRRCFSTDSSLHRSPNPSESDSYSIDSFFVQSTTILETIEEEKEDKSNM